MTPVEDPRPVRLLFVCVENACRSQMAGVFARLHGGPGVEGLRVRDEIERRVSGLLDELKG